MGLKHPLSIRRRLLGLALGAFWSGLPPLTLARPQPPSRLTPALGALQQIYTADLKLYAPWNAIAQGQPWGVSAIAIFIATWEGQGRASNGRLWPYRGSSGQTLIGYGYVLQPAEQRTGKIYVDHRPIAYRQGITQRTALLLLEQELDRLRPQLRSLIQVELPPHRFDVLLSFTYNVGLDAFRQSTLLHRLNAGQLDAVPAELRQWTKVGQREVVGLVRRRQAEIELWQTGYGTANAD